MVGFIVFSSLTVSLTFIYLIVRMGIRHSENIERIKHGYPLLDGTRPIKDEFTEIQPFETRLQ